jgi:hypothetical protein
MDIIKCLLSDQFIFPAFQAGFLLFTIFAWAKDRGLFTPNGSVSLSVKRGEKSWNYFHLAYALLVVVFVEAINTMEAWKGYKTLVTIVDLALLLYLCFFNGWCRNKILGVINASQQMEER